MARHESPFQRFRQPPAHQLPGRRPPPDYTRQRVKLRLFTYVAALMLVLFVIDKVRNPAAWQWLAGRQNGAGAPAGDKPAAQKKQPVPGQLRTADDPPGTFVAVDDAPAPQMPDSAEAETPAESAWPQAWRDVLPRLSAVDRDLVFELLHAALERQTLAAAKTDEAAGMLKRLADAWKEHLAVARRSLSSLPEEEQATWNGVLYEAKRRFEEDVRTALTAVIDGRTPTEQEETTLRKLQTTLVAVAKGSVRDDTPVFRPAEREYWFYQLARVRQFGADKPKQQAPRVSCLQLEKQPGEYRGELVTVAGTVRLAERVPAPPNYLGVSQYYVYWIQPAGEPDSPLIVYALEVPRGFPRIKSRDDRAAMQSVKLREDVQVTGVFFKRCVYAARGGTFTAPVLLADVPEWSPPEPRAAERPVPWRELGIAALAALLLAICVTAVVWKRTGQSGRAAKPPTHGGFASLGNLQVGPPRDDSLRLP
jgi:hypothetical protein